MSTTTKAEELVEALELAANREAWAADGNSRKALEQAQAHTDEKRAALLSYIQELEKDRERAPRDSEIDYVYVAKLHFEKTAVEGPSKDRTLAALRSLCQRSGFIDAARATEAP